MATTASLSKRLGTLAIGGDAAADEIVVGRSADGALLVDDGATRIKGGKASVANTDLVVVSAGAGDDRVTVDAADGTLPRIAVAGGAGLDTLVVAGSAAASSTEIGGADGVATITGQTADGASLDLTLAGVETLVLEPGAGGDEVIVGPLAGSGVARVEVRFGDDGATDVLALHTAGDGSALLLTLASGVATVEGAGIELGASGVDAGDRFAVLGSAAAERIDARGVAQRVDMLGFGGADTLLGGAGNDALQAMDGDDAVTGGAGADLVSLADGDDVAHWAAGDGSDTVAGGAGSDRLEMSGTAAADLFGVIASGAGVLASHGGLVGNLSVDGVETLRIAAGAGADGIAIGALAGTGVQRVEVDLGSDGVPDTLQVAGLTGAGVPTDGALVFTLSSGVQLVVTGVDAAVDTIGPLFG